MSHFLCAVGGVRGAGMGGPGAGVVSGSIRSCFKSRSPVKSSEMNSFESTNEMRSSLSADDTSDEPSSSSPSNTDEITGTISNSSPVGSLLADSMTDTTILSLLCSNTGATTATILSLLFSDSGATTAAILSLLFSNSGATTATRLRCAVAGVLRPKLRVPLPSSPTRAATDGGELRGGKFGLRWLGPRGDAGSSATLSRGDTRPVARAESCSVASRGEVRPVERVSSTQVSRGGVWPVERVSGKLVSRGDMRPVRRGDVGGESDRFAAARTSCAELLRGDGVGDMRAAGRGDERGELCDGGSGAGVVGAPRKAGTGRGASVGRITAPGARDAHDIHRRNLRTAPHA